MSVLRGIGIVLWAALRIVALFVWLALKLFVRLVWIIVVGVISFTVMGLVHMLIRG
ncbi:MAG: hypothetical protein QM705_11150 [Ancrocorticia sp.]